MHQPELLSVAGSLSVRPLNSCDLPRILEIENLSSPFPWDLEIFRGCMGPTYVCLVLEADAETVGFAVASAAAREGHLLNIAIDPGCRCRGLGTLLLGAVLDVLEQRSAINVFLEVRRSNNSAIRLYRRFGFEPIGLRKDYYTRVDGCEDAITMKRSPVS